MKYILLFFTLFCSFTTSAQTDDHQQTAGIMISVPVINNVQFYDYNSKENMNQTGYFGIGTSLFYKSGKNKFSIGVEFPLLKKSLFNPKGGYTDINCTLFEALIDHRISNQLAVIEGLNYASYQFHSYSDMPGFSNIDKTDATIGLTTGAEFIATKTTSFLLIYRPALFSFDNKNYRHTFSLDCRFNINFWKHKRV